MRSPTPRRPVLVAALCALCLSQGCAREKKPEAAEQTASTTTPRDEIPSDKLSQVMDAHYAGVALIRRYDYDKAIDKFRVVHSLAPDWIPGSINLAIGLLNKSGAAASKAGKGAPAKGHYEEALELLGDVLKRDPKNLQAHYCRGMIFHNLGRMEEAHKEFLAVTEEDPNDAQAWLNLGSTLTNPENPGFPAGPKQAKELIAIYTKALELNPYLAATLYKLQSAYGLAGDRTKQKELAVLWKRLDPSEDNTHPGDSSDGYGEMGRYSLVVGPVAPREIPSGPVVPPRFETPKAMNVALAKGDRWVKSADFSGKLAVNGRVRSRFGAAVAILDADGDGKADVFLASAIVGPKGIRDALLLNRGGGKFEDATLAFGLSETRASLGVAAGDFDADLRTDLFLTGVGDNRLLRNLGAKFEDATEKAGLPASSGVVSLTARWLDLDQDGDIDLYVVNYAKADDAETAFTDKTPKGTPNFAYRNDGQPVPTNQPPNAWTPRAMVLGSDAERKGASGLSIAMKPWPDAPDLFGGDATHTAVAALDIDDDRDIDLIISADGSNPVAILNDRLGRFHSEPLVGAKAEDRTSGLLVGDIDKDGKTDLIGVSAGGPVAVWRNQTRREGTRMNFDFALWQNDAKDWRSALLADLDLDGWPDLLGVPADEPPAPAWSRNEGVRLATRRLALGPDDAGTRPLLGLALSDLIGDALPDLVLVRDGEAPRLARNLGNGNHWLAIELGGRWKAGKQDRMRCNSHGLGTRLAIEGQGLNVSYDHTTPVAGLAQSVAPIVLGLGRHDAAPMIRIRWPDGCLQCELNVPVDHRLALTENNLRPSSCPVLFTWNGERFVCVADFLGGGGLGYLVAPGVYGQPDRDEAVAIGSDQLKAVDGAYRLVVSEPMSEVSYLDQLRLEVVDAPPGLNTVLDERFSPGGRRPTGRLIAYKQSYFPRKATDLKGNDLTDTLKSWDRRTADDIRVLNGWPGYTEEHGIVLDFGDRLAGIGERDELILCLAGWVEYPYSQTNYAASTAGVALKPPVLERRRPDGSWEVIEKDLGYPAGLPRMTSINLTGKLTGPSCVLRLKTNMECYWDQAFVATPEVEARVRATSLPLRSANLAYRGYAREVSPDGRPPFLSDYDHVDPAPLAGLAGRLTRYGEVGDLLRSDDDRLCLVGPGDEVRLEFDARSAPELPVGWTRSFVLRGVGYCKDADPFTGASDTIGPLPWRDMPAYPFPVQGERPRDKPYDDYLREYQSRPSGAR